MTHEVLDDIIEEWSPEWKVSESNEELLNLGNGPLTDVPKE